MDVSCREISRYVNPLIVTPIDAMGVSAMKAAVYVNLKMNCLRFSMLNYKTTTSYIF